MQRRVLYISLSVLILGAVLLNLGIWGGISADVQGEAFKSTPSLALTTLGGIVLILISMLILAVAFIRHRLQRRPDGPTSN